MTPSEHKDEISQKTLSHTIIPKFVRTFKLYMFVSSCQIKDEIFFSFS